MIGGDTPESVLLSLFVINGISLTLFIGWYLVLGAVPHHQGARVDPLQLCHQEQPGPGAHGLHVSHGQLYLLRYQEE